MSTKLIAKTEVRELFSGRLNKLLDAYDFPKKNEGRQVQLAKRLGVSQETVRKWLDGESVPRIEKIWHLSHIFPCRAAWLIAGDLPMTADKKTEELLAIWSSLPESKKLAILETIRPIPAEPKNE